MMDASTRIAKRRRVAGMSPPRPPACSAVFEAGPCVVIPRRATNPSDTEAVSSALRALVYDAERRLLYAVVPGAGRVVTVDSDGLVTDFARVPSPWHLALVPPARRSVQEHLVVCTYQGDLWVLARSGGARKVRLPPDAALGHHIYGFALDSRGRALVSDVHRRLFVRYSFRLDLGSDLGHAPGPASDREEGPPLAADLELLRYPLPSQSSPSEIACDEDDGIVAFDLTTSTLLGATVTGGRLTVRAAGFNFSNACGIARDPRSGCVFLAHADGVQVVEPLGRTYALTPLFAGRGDVWACAFEPSGDALDGALLVSLAATPPLATWPSGLAGIVELYARRPALPHALWISGSGALWRMEIRRVQDSQFECA
jgi:hypothetical protein